MITKRLNVANPDVIFIGAGPVGLWSAILLKKRMPALNIMMKEKNAEPSRTQVLHIDKTCFKGSNEEHELAVFVSSLSSSVKILDLEKQLRLFAESLGINIVSENITNCQTQIFDRYPETKVFIGADGARSIFRKEIFGTESTIELLDQDLFSSSA